MNTESIAMKFFVLLAMFVVNYCDSDGNLVIRTDNGKVLGTASIDIKRNKVYSFQSIPYAKPPVGDLRFKDPEPVGQWKHLLDATQAAPMCPQDDDVAIPTGMVGQEDCLYLNIHTPRIPDKKDDNRNATLLPVMVFIHGGAFRAGWSHPFSPAYLLPKNVVLVTINYRLGFLGFLNFQNHDVKVPGNAGLKDQVMALKWIKDNIEFFGGHPDSVTIFGQSSGAACVHLLVLSPMAKGLFHRAIAESGSALSLWAQGKKDNGRKLGEALNINTSDDAQLLNELRKVPVEKIIRAQYLILSDVTVSNQWDASAVVEAQTDSPIFLPNDSIALIKHGNFSAVPLMMGYNSEEGMLMQLLEKKRTGNFFIMEDYKKHLPYVLKGDKKKMEVIAQKVKRFYEFQNKTAIQPSINFMTDTMFFYRIYQSVLEHCKAGKAPVYFYRFSADTKLNIGKRSDPDLMDYPGASHGDETGYLFSLDSSVEILPRSDESRGYEHMVTMWTNFAKYGNPTPRHEKSLDNQTWEPFKLDTTFLFEIGNDLSISDNPDFERIKFWNSIYYTYG